MSCWLPLRRWYLYGPRRKRTGAKKDSTRFPLLQKYPLKVRTSSFSVGAGQARGECDQPVPAGLQLQPHPNLGFPKRLSRDRNRAGTTERKGKRLRPCEKVASSHLTVTRKTSINLSCYAIITQQ